MTQKGPQNYEEWIELSREEKQAIKREWNVYDREGYGFALCAVGRLVIQSPVKIFEAEVGIWHGGHNIIHAYVSDEDYPQMPAPLEQEFEGFRVFWMPMSEHWGLCYKPQSNVF